MELSEFDAYIESKQEPVKGCLLALKEIILSHHPDFTVAWKYRMPFFCFRGKMCCYFWLDKKTHEPYIGVVNGNKFDLPFLEQGDRSRMRILRINPEKDIPLERVETILDKIVHFK